MRLFSIAGFCAAALALLAGCQTTDQAGTAPITSMGKNTIDTYHHYRQAILEYKRSDMAFVYNEQKKVSFWAGRSKQDGISHVISVALKSCHEKYPDLTCKVFDINGRIVWKGVSDDLLAQLNNVPSDVSVGQNYPYNEAEYKISLKQNRDFDRYLNNLKHYDHSAFYISKDGVSSGSLFMYGASSYRAAQYGALKSCLVKSKNKRCYHFAQDGKPINEEARIAIYGRN